MAKQLTQAKTKIASVVGAAIINPVAGPNASPTTLAASNDVREELRERVKNSLYFLCKGVLGLVDLHPVLHKQMCDSAQSRLVRRSVNLWPRDHYKTSIYSIGLPIYEYVNDQNVTCLIAGSTSTNASRRLRRIQAVFERNKIFRWLFPELIPADFNKRWNENESLCPRTEDRLEPTFDTIGVGGRVTGRHYGIKLTDDMVDETCLDSSGLPSQVAMDAAFQWFDYSEYLLESEHTSRDIVVGTRWAREDPYELIKKDPRYLIERHSADGGCCEDHPAGTPIFPVGCNRCANGVHAACKTVGFSMEYLNVLQKKDPYKYALQMRNDPVDSSITEFKRDWLQYLTWDNKADTPTMLLGSRRVRISSCNTYLIVDPAYTKKKRNDPTGFLVGAITPHGDLIVIDTQETRMDPIELVDGIYNRWLKWRPHEVLVEEVAAAKFISPFLSKKAEENDVYIRVRPVKPAGNDAKRVRIRGLSTPFSHMQIWIAPGQTNFVNQLVSYPSSRDHLLDCLAYLFSDSRKPMSEEEEDDMAAAEDEILRAMNSTTGY